MHKGWKGSCRLLATLCDLSMFVKIESACWNAQTVDCTWLYSTYDAWFDQHVTCKCVLLVFMARIGYKQALVYALTAATNMM